MSSNKDIIDRLEAEVIFSKYKRKLIKLTEEENTEKTKGIENTTEFIEKMTPYLLKICTAMIDAGFNPFERSRIIKGMIRILVETLTPIEVYGLFASIQFNIESELHESTPIPIIVADLSYMEKDKDEVKNPLAM